MFYYVVEVLFPPKLITGLLVVSAVVVLLVWLFGDVVPNGLNPEFNVPVPPNTGLFWVYPPAPKFKFKFVVVVFGYWVLVLVLVLVIGVKEIVGLFPWALIGVKPVGLKPVVVLGGVVVPPPPVFYYAFY